MNSRKMLTVGRRSRPSHVLPWGDTNIGQFLKIKRMSTTFPLTQCINPTSIKMRGLSCVVTSRQVYLGIDIYPRSIFSFNCAPILLLLQVSGRHGTFTLRLTRSKFAVQGHGRFYALTSFLLKAWENYRGLRLLSGGNPIPKIALGYLST